MTAVLMGPGGLRAVMEAFLGGLPQQEEALQVDCISVPTPKITTRRPHVLSHHVPPHNTHTYTQAHARVASLLATCPRSVSPHAYLEALAPQFPPLLHAPAHDQALVHKYGRVYVCACRVGQCL